MIIVLRLQNDSIRSNTIQYDAKRRNTMQCDSIRLNTIQYDQSRLNPIRYASVRLTPIQYDGVGEPICESGRTAHSSGNDKDGWVPLKGTCAFQERPKEMVKVHARCREVASMMQMLIATMEDKMSRFNKMYKLTSRPEEETKIKRSHAVSYTHLTLPTKA